MESRKPLDATAWKRSQWHCWLTNHSLDKHYWRCKTMRALLTAPLLDKACYYNVPNKCRVKKNNQTNPKDWDWQRPITTTPQNPTPRPPSKGLPLALCQVDAWNEFGKSSICRTGVEILAWILKTFQTGETWAITAHSPVRCRCGAACGNV